jgi:hypothetical protein
VGQAERDTGAAGLRRGASMQELVDRLALVLGEHMHDGDELHVTYNAMQYGWQEHPRPRAI